jgi:pimeloyl-ACP methyl ester carboxylesterase
MTPGWIEGQWMDAKPPSHDCGWAAITPPCFAIPSLARAQSTIQTCLRRDIPGAGRMELLPQTGHLLMEERPEQFGAIVSGFLA